jgi:hypothetical protein
MKRSDLEAFRRAAIHPNKRKVIKTGPDGKEKQQERLPEGFYSPSPPQAERFSPPRHQVQLKKQWSAHLSIGEMVISFREAAPRAP